MSKNYTGRVVLILFVMLIAFLGFDWLPGWLNVCGKQSSGGIFTWEKLRDSKLAWKDRFNLKPGIDIAGGTKLLYEIAVPPGGYASPTGNSLAEDMAIALKRRVDPDGVRNLVWRPQGQTRLEIQIPRSPDSERAAAVHKTLAAAQEELQNSNTRPPDVIYAVEKEQGDARTQRLKQLAGGSAERLKLYQQMADVYDAQRKARADFDKAVKEKNTALQNQSADLAAAKETEYEAIKTKLQNLNLSERQLQDILDNPNAAERDQKLQQLRTEYAGFPARVKAINDYATAYAASKTVTNVIDDATELKRLLRGSGVLEFHIVVDNVNSPEAQTMVERLRAHGDTPARGVSPSAGDTMRWYLVDRPEDFHAQTFPYNGRAYVLAYTQPVEDGNNHGKALVHDPRLPPWTLEKATPSLQNGGRLVEFSFDAQGAKYFGDLTASNLQKPLGIVLDDKMISAPTIQSQITSSGQITGNFSESDINYLVNTLNAGSLPAQLANDPISEQTISPSFGADNLYAALEACGIGLGAVAIFLVAYYYLSGIVAFIAVVMNLLIILGVLAVFNATFTLPAIAGIVLTVGTAIDANVLVFERLREEQHRGLTLKLALRNAFERARSAIIDSNVTTIITSAVLYALGSEEVKGFGLTLLIGIFSSLFTALFVTKTILGILVDRVGVKQLSSFPLTFPKWDKLLKPNINWMSLVWPFVAFSILFIGVGLSAFVIYQKEMYDIEFVSGVSVQFTLKDKTPIKEVHKLLDPVVKSGAIPSPQVQSINGSDRVYEVVTPNQDQEKVKDAIISTFGDRLELELPSKFSGAGENLENVLVTNRGVQAAPATSPAASAPASAPAFASAVNEPSQGAAVFPIETDNLVIDGHTIPDVTAFKGGVAVVLRDIEPAISPNEIQRRINRAISLSTGQGASRDRSFQVYPLSDVNSNNVADTPTSAALVLAYDPGYLYGKSPDDWRENLARPVWSLVNEGVNREARLDKLTKFDPQVAGDTRMQAYEAAIISVLLIMAWIWVRFGNFKYGTATVVAMLHDTLVVLGAIGLSHYLANSKVGDFLLLEPFRVNLTLVAAILTVMSYSMIDTIVVFDRIRENRGKFGKVTRQVINDSVNQTLSRTMLTAGITIVMVATMYIWGGAGIHGFTFVLLVGILFGTYSSIAIASPLLLLGKEKTRAVYAKPGEVAGGVHPSAAPRA